MAGFGVLWRIWQGVHSRLDRGLHATQRARFWNDGASRALAGCLPSEGRTQIAAFDVLEIIDRPVFPPGFSHLDE